MALIHLLNKMVWLRVESLYAILQGWGVEYVGSAIMFKVYVIGLLWKKLLLSYYETSRSNVLSTIGIAWILSECIGAVVYHQACFLLTKNATRSLLGQDICPLIKHKHPEGSRALTPISARTENQSKLPMLAITYALLKPMRKSGLPQRPFGCNGAMPGE